MKTTGSYGWVISTWIKQEQSEGGSPYVNCHAYFRSSGMEGHTGRRMFFKGDTIYSYHTWWPMAKILPGKLALVNREKYSVTTTAHTNQVESALLRAGFACFDVERSKNLKGSLVWGSNRYTEYDLIPDPNYLLAEYKRVYDETRRSRDRLAADWRDPLEYLKNARKSYVDFCNRFGFAIEFDLTPDQWKALNDRIKEYKRRAEVKRFAHRLLTGEAS